MRCGVAWCLLSLPGLMEAWQVCPFSGYGYSLEAYSFHHFMINLEGEE